MALSRQDCVILVREIEGLIREHDPAALESVLTSAERYDDPGRYVVELLRTLRSFYAERSGGQNGAILDRVNRYVRQPNGQPVRGISVELTPIERERYRTAEVNFAELPDRTEFIVELERILELVIHELRDSEEMQ